MWTRDQSYWQYSWFIANTRKTVIYSSALQIALVFGDSFSLLKKQNSYSWIRTSPHRPTASFMTSSLPTDSLTMHRLTARLLRSGVKSSSDIWIHPSECTANRMGKLSYTTLSGCSHQLSATGVVQHPTSTERRLPSDPTELHQRKPTGYISHVTNDVISFDLLLQVYCQT